MTADPLHAMSNVLSLNQFVATRTASFRQYVVLLSVIQRHGAAPGRRRHLRGDEPVGDAATGEIGIRMAFGAQAVTC
jgi:hypothetical protein